MDKKRTNLKILKVQDPKHLKTKPLHEHLPQPPALVMMISPVKTGKSTIISNLLLGATTRGTRRAKVKSRGGQRMGSVGRRCCAR